MTLLELADNLDAHGIIPADGESLKAYVKRGRHTRGTLQDFREYVYSGGLGSNPIFNGVRYKRLNETATLDSLGFNSNPFPEIVPEDEYSRGILWGRVDAKSTYAGFVFNIDYQESDLPIIIVGDTSPKTRLHEYIHAVRNQSGLDTRLSRNGFLSDMAKEAVAHVAQRGYLSLCNETTHCNIRNLPEFHMVPHMISVAIGAGLALAGVTEIGKYVYADFALSRDAVIGYMLGMTGLCVGISRSVKSLRNILDRIGQENYHSQQLTLKEYIDNHVTESLPAAAAVRLGLSEITRICSLLYAGSDFNQAINAMGIEPWRRDIILDRVRSAPSVTISQFGQSSS